jgi:hypothetical protein
MLLAVAGLVAAMVTAAPAAADVTGKWEGKITAQREDGSAVEDGALVILQQKGTVLTGTVGNNEDDRHPIVSGKIDGNKITLAAKNKNNDREYQIELTVEGDQMKGTMVSGQRKGNIELKRRKE